MPGDASWSLVRTAREEMETSTVTGYSLTYRRLFELEVRLLEKSGLVRVVYLVSWYCDEVLWQKQSIGIWFATTLEILSAGGRLCSGIWESLNCRFSAVG